MKFFKSRNLDRFYLLRSDSLAVYMSTKGAEIMSVKNTQTKTDYMWDGDPDYWNRRAPHLFPIVGGLKNNTYTYEGKTYHLGRHGFARDMIFEKTAETQNQIWFELSANEETMKDYPFRFHLTVRYTLSGNRLEVRWYVRNEDDKAMPFSIGGHPGFRCPINGKGSQTDYYLRFEMEGKGNPVYRTLERSSGLMGEETFELPLKKDLYKIKKDTFAIDTLIFEQQTTKVELLRPNHRPYIAMTCAAPVIGIWSPAGRHAPFICIEPWYGRCDRSDYEGDIFEREWSQTLQPGEEFEAAYFLEFF